MSRTATPALEISDLRFRYASDGAWVVGLPTLRLERGEQVALQGSSGSGKSSLLQVVAGLVDPQGGSVRIAGADIHALRGARRDRFRGSHLGMIFQTFNLLPGFSATENVQMALLFSRVPRREHRSRSADLLRSLSIDAPDREVTELSVGQQQRVAVARALACDPPLVLADEPTASLDPENAARAIELIQSACRERNAALLCVSHDPSVIERFETRHALAGLRASGAAG